MEYYYYTDSIRFRTKIAISYARYMAWPWHGRYNSISRTPV